MTDGNIVRRLIKQISSDIPTQQGRAIDNIGDLSAQSEFCRDFGEAGAITLLASLLGGDKELTSKALRALIGLAGTESNWSRILEADGVANTIDILRDNQQNHEIHIQALQLLDSLALHEASCLAMNKANAVAAIVRVIKSSENEELRVLACKLLGQIGQNKLVKNSVRENHGIAQMIEQLLQKSASLALQEAIIQSLAILVMENEINQDHVRDLHGIEPIVEVLNSKAGSDLAISAVKCLTALCINNAENQNHMREIWAIPLLVNLLEQPDHLVQEKAVDCLRVLTTGNDLNKLSLFSIPAGVRSLVSIMTCHSATEMITERAAAVIGNLSTTEQFFPAIRECGGLQRLVTLLDSGPESRVTEIAAKTLANMAGNDNNRKGIRLAGGVPPLIHLLTLRPNNQVLIASEHALKRLNITNEERNAVLETLRYCELYQGLHTKEQPLSGPQQQSQAVAADPKLISSSARPLTQWTVEECCELLQKLGIKNTDLFETNSVTGGDLLDLSAEEMSTALGMTPLQVKKLEKLKLAFELFESINLLPGKADISQYELWEWLRKEKQKTDEDIHEIMNGLKKALSRDMITFISFAEFCFCYQWLMRTLQDSCVCAADNNHVPT